MSMKKILCIFIVLLMTVGIVPANAFYDIKDDEVRIAVDRLVDLGIISGYPNNTFMPDNPISRAEFAKVIVEMKDYPLINEEKLFFSDSKDSWAREYIASSKFFSIVNGKPGNIFAPKDYITYNEVIKMVVASLGYEDAAQSMGGYPHGYINQANQLGILKGIEYNGLDNATRGDVAIIVNNALNATVYAVPEEILFHPDYQNEKVKIDKNDKIYALGRILMGPQLRGRLNISGYDSDLGMFEYPDGIVTNAQKIDYLSKASYILTEDITVNFNIKAKNLETAYGSFAGIGTENTSVGFQGYFNGNNKTITIKSSGIEPEQANEYVTYNIGLFNQLINAEVFDLNIRVDNDVVVTSNRNNYNFGLLAGKVTASTIYNVNVNINNGAKVGVVQSELSSRNNNIGGIAGVVQGYKEFVEGSKIKNCSVNLNDNSELIGEKTKDSEGRIYLGGIVGYSCGTSEERNSFENCKVTLNNSDIVVNGCKEQGVVGGIVAYSLFSDVNNCEVDMIDGSIGAAAENTNITVYSNNQQEYFKLAAGGIMGYSSAGSNNITNLGTIGNTIKECRVSSKNSQKKEIIYAKQKAGTAPNVGGILGLSFNNCLVEKCVFEADKGVILSERTESYDDIKTQYGGVAGGIVGRLEHT
ncbi:MAG: S-layer homology domain-containing protein, partial [Ruminococcaceae bacterium]|nr:S-layer homology domain-containing protein [Oscillospiraceae bacterium]